MLALSYSGLALSANPAKDTTKDFVSVNDLKFNFDPNANSTGPSSNFYQQRSWKECRRAPTAPSDPESGC